jgi:hypothetical protein
MNEQPIVSNIFGTVTHTAVRFNVKKWIFAGTSEETLPIRHVTSVRVETSRHWIWGILLVILGLATLKIGVGILFLALAIILIWGSPKVVVNTAGGDLRPSVSWPWKRDDARLFEKALREELLTRG